MNIYKKYIIYFSLFFLFIFLIIFFIYLNNKEIVLEGCNDKHIGSHIKKAIKHKYSGSIILSSSNKYHESRGSFVIAKILSLKGINTEIFKCGEIYNEEQCNIKYLRDNKYYNDSNNEKYDLIRLDSCYYNLATFNNDKQLCYKINEAETQSHCFTFFKSKQ